jgi:hypothetical protein
MKQSITAFIDKVLAIVNNNVVKQKVIEDGEKSYMILWFSKDSSMDPSMDQSMNLFIDSLLQEKIGCSLLNNDDDDDDDDSNIKRYWKLIIFKNWQYRMEKLIELWKKKIKEDPYNESHKHTLQYFMRLHTSLIEIFG